MTVLEKQIDVRTARLRLRSLHPDGEMMCFSNPHSKEMPHISTSLTRTRFMALAG